MARTARLPRLPHSVHRRAPDPKPSGNLRGADPLRLQVGDGREIDRTLAPLVDAGRLRAGEREEEMDMMAEAWARELMHEQ